MAPFLLQYNMKALAACSMVRLLLVASFLIAHLSAATAHHNSSCFPLDLQALTSFAAALSPALLLPFRDDTFLQPLAMNESWNSERECCSWEGVTCTPSTSSPAVDAHNNSGSSYARVTALALNFTQFSPSSPSVLKSLCNLPLLSALHLSIVDRFSNVDQFSEYDLNYRPSDVLLQIPECLGEQLPLLKILHLFHLHLKGPIPSSFSRLRHLRELDLSVNPALSGPLLPLLHLPHLTSLDLFSCSFSGPLPNFHTPLLQTLDLSYNAFSGPLPAFNGTPFLQSLSLSSNSLDCSSSDHSFIRLSNLTALTYLHLSSNEFAGPFPPSIGHFSSLLSLSLSFNKFAGPIPHEWQNLQNLSWLDLSGNSLNGTGLPEWLFRLPQLEVLELSSMGLQSEDVLCSTRLCMLNKTLWLLDLSANNITGSNVLECFGLHNFNHSYLSLKLDGNPLSISLPHVRLAPAIRDLSLSASNLTGFLNSQVLEGRTWLDLSNNHLVGRIPLAHANLTSSMEFLDLSGNLFTGVDSFGTFQSLLQMNLSHNAIGGRLSTLVGSNLTNSPLMPSLFSLDLSYNELTGQLPAFAATDMFQALNVLHLDNNNLTGEIPENLESLKKTSFIRLNNNNLKGAIPPSIISQNLRLLELSYNHLVGNLHTLFSFLNSPTNLIMLGLAHNCISGSIPPFLGHFTPTLCVVDLSHNNLSGHIPRGPWLPSFQSVKTMAHDETNIYDLKLLYGEIEHLVIKGVERPLEYVWNNFRFLDLSENHLEGVIPSELGDLLALLQLNLSHNSLSGPIPDALGKLSLLEVLDLSYNQLQGSIPLSFSSLTKLSIFNVSYNKALVGSIPPGTQLENNESYIGDPLLYGCTILQRTCQTIDVTNSLNNMTLNDTESTWIDKWVSLPGFCLSFVVGLLGVLWVLHGPWF